MTLLLTNEEVAQAVTMTECVDALEDAFREVGEGWAFSDLRVDRHLPVTKQALADELGVSVDRLARHIIDERQAKDAHIEPEALDAPLVYLFKTMFGAIHSTGIVAVRTSSEVISFPTIDGRTRYSKIPSAPGGRYTSMILLFSARTGQLLCVMPDGMIQRNRVAATGAVGTRHLARRDVRVMGLLGTGLLAGGSLEASLAVRPEIEEVRVFSPNPEHRRDFIDEWRGKVTARLVEARNEEEVVREAELLVAATNALAPIVQGEWLSPGVHVSSTTGELDDDCFRRADVALTTSRSWGVEDYVMPAALNEIPLFTKPDSAKTIDHGPTWPPGRLPAASWPRWNLEEMAELGELLTGRAHTRTDDAQVTVHFNCSAGVQFAAVGGRILAGARERGLGRDLPSEWFSQDMHP